MHVSRLEPWKSREGEELSERNQDLPELEDDTQEWEIEELRDKQELIKKSIT